MSCVGGNTRFGRFGCGTGRTGIRGGSIGFRVNVTSPGPSCLQIPCPPLPCDNDFVPPTVISFAPISGATILDGQVFTITLSEVVTGIQVGVGSCNVYVTRGVTPVQVAGVVAYDGNVTVTFTPSENYCPDTAVTLHVGVLSTDPCPGIFDDCGNRLQPQTSTYIVDCGVS